MSTGLLIGIIVLAAGGLLFLVGLIPPTVAAVRWLWSHRTGFWPRVQWMWWSRGLWLQWLRKIFPGFLIAGLVVAWFGFVIVGVATS